MGLELVRGARLERCGVAKFCGDCAALKLAATVTIRMSQAEFQIVRLQKGKVKVEVLGKPGMVTKYREGKVGLNDAVIDDRVFLNASKGDLPSEADIKELGCSGRALLELIMKTGKYSYTAQEKREFVEKKKAEVINFIHENFIDSTNGRPHPVTRIENALTEIKAQYDPEQEAEKIARSLLPKLQTIIRLAESAIEGTVKIPNSKLGQCIGIIYNLGTVLREEYGPENAYIEMKVSPGKFDALNDQLSKMSQGEAVFQIKGAAATCEGDEKEQTHVKKRRAGGKKK